MKLCLRDLCCAISSIFLSALLTTNVEAQSISNLSFGSAVLTNNQGSQVVLRTMGSFSPSLTPGTRLISVEGNCANCFGPSFPYIEVPCDNPGRITGTLNSNNEIELLSVACSEEIGSTGQYRTRLLSGPVFSTPYYPTLLIPIQQEVIAVHTNRIRQLRMFDNENRNKREVALALEIVHSHEEPNLSSPYDDGQVNLYGPNNYISREVSVKRYRIRTNLSSPWSLNGQYQTESEVATFDSANDNLYIATCGENARNISWAISRTHCLLEDLSISRLPLFSPNLSTYSSININPLPVASFDFGSILFDSGLYYYNYGFRGNLHVVEENSTGELRFIAELAGVGGTTMPVLPYLPDSYGAISFKAINGTPSDISRIGSLPLGSYTYYDIEPNSCGKFMAGYWEQEVNDPNEFYHYEAETVSLNPALPPSWIGRYHEEVGFSQSYEGYDGSSALFWMFHQKPQLDNQGRIWDSWGSALQTPTSVGPTCP